MVPQDKNSLPAHFKSIKIFSLNLINLKSRPIQF